MVDVIYDNHFLRTISKIKDKEVQKSIKNKISKIIENPEIGKPMRNARKGTRGVYIVSARLAYEYNKERDALEFLELYHKDEQ